MSPFTDGFGYLGDRIRVARQQSAIKALARSREIAEQENIELSPLPPKNLVKLIEGASAEDPESDLLEFWARLFVSSTQNEEALNLLFSEILGRMSTKQAEYFKRIGGRNPLIDPEDSLYSTRNSNWSIEISSDAEEIYQEFLSNSSKRRANEGTRAIQDCLKTFNWSQCSIGRVGVSLGGFSHNDVQEENDLIAREMLIREGLVVARNLNAGANSGWSINLEIYELTVIGGLFAKAIFLGK